ncbi:MAG: helicase [Cyclobacteriaceae bacterium]|nr:helicase [Cyclobacteriaceae bacterium]
MSTKFFTNQSTETSLLTKFEGVFGHVPTIHCFDALVGYFRASGYFHIRPFLNRIPKIRILVGINVDKLTKKYHDKGQYYLENPEDTKEAFLEETLKNIQEADYDDETESGILQFIDDLITGKVELRAHPKKKIHAKVYIFRPANFNEHAPCEVITGSSNLTDSGLGSFPDSNYEFNVSLRDYDDVKFATDEFEHLWEESVPILTAEAKRLKKESYLRDDYTPFELYMKMLIEYFGKRVDYDPYNIELLLPDKYRRLKYQSDAANQGFAIMMKHNGFILADVVGLGKTIVACMIIKKFVYENGTHTKVLVVVPPAIKSSWQTTVKEFQLDNHFRFITLGSLHKILDTDNSDFPNPEEFDLVVVDESHKFRNDYTDMYVKLQEICKRPRSRAAENGDTRKKVILVSATPLNNRPQDIENQLYLFQDRRNCTLENIQNLQEYFKKINDTYQKLAGETPLNIPKLKQLFEKLRNDVIEPLVIRRTRTDIENNQEYLDDIREQGIEFPKIDDPISLHYKLDRSLSQLFLDTVELITGIDEDGEETEGLGYYRYRAIEYLANDSDKRIYGDVRSISGRLSAIMRTLLVKRLESSVYAFTQSLTRLGKAVDNMISMLDHDRVFIAPDLDINFLLEEGLGFDEIEAKINQKGGNNREFKATKFRKDFYGLLKSDKRLIDGLIERWKAVRIDPKLVEFMKQIDSTFFIKKRNPSGKLVVFTESKETADELTEKLIKKGGHKILSISADNRQPMEATIRNNFDANLDPEKWRDEYDIIITTEVLAEGINLHRSNTIVNYDVPWNATRLMQRIGRVNRIGSTAKQVYVYNYYPSAQGDAQIQLVNNALRKLQAFHSAFGEDNKIFSLLEEKGEGGLFGSKIQREESEILKYLNELRTFRKSNPKLFKQLAKIPSKARCGRKATQGQEVNLISTADEQLNYPLQHTSIAYLKSDNHPGIFCLVTPDLGAVELNFLEAARVYRADQHEKAVPLHQSHHSQVLAALDFFKSEKNQDSLQGVSSKSLSNVEKKAIKNLNAVVKHAPTEQKRKAMLRVIEIIKKGTFASKGMPKSVNDFFAANGYMLKDHEQFFDLLFKTVLDRYDLSSRVEDGHFSEQAGYRGIINPRIVLTQSFE